ncbi:WD40-repeat-containing domain protein [Kalaharituber pfeilii]|nr:WD40-repeat-containing domain protein [Kalaharituber pfeilii]
MAGRFVRASKYRHIFGRSTKKELCYDNLHISKNAWDSNIIKANPVYLAVNWESGGGGAFAVIPLSQKGRAPEQIPLFRGHTAPVLDTDWSPFDDSLIASGSDDGKVFIWKVPENFSLISDDDKGPQDVSPINKLSGHTRKVGHVLFHPVAENVLATNSGDFTVKLWDIETGESKLTLRHNELVQSISFSGNGALMVTTSRDKKLRIWDLRQEKAVHETQGHTGAKNSRSVWMGEVDRIATTGFSRTSDRQLGLWDPRQPNEPIGGFQTLDSIAGICMPFWDDGTKCLYLAGRGDGNIRYFEYANDELIYLSEYKSADAQRGVAFIPKRGVALHENEVMRAFKTVNDTYIEPISFIVPRRLGRPGLTASEWFGGKDASIPLFDLEHLYSADGTGVDVSAAKTFEQVTAPSPAPVPVKQPATPVETKVAVTVLPPASENPVRPPSPIKQEAPQTFEIPALKKVGRPSTPPQAAPMQAEPKVEKPAPVEIKRESPTTAAPVFLQHAYWKQTTADISVLASIPTQLQKITTLLETQNKQLESQTDQISELTKQLECQTLHVSELTKEVDGLKTQIGSEQAESAKKDEIIRKLELELEQARS